MTEAKKQAADLPWITDRVPTAEDAGTDGTVITTENSRFSSWSYDSWQDVKLGTPWLAYSPPLKPEKETIHQQTTTKLKELPWITDELPTAKDANPIGGVTVYLDHLNKSVTMHWSCVRKGMKWLPDYMGVVAERIAKQESQLESKLARKFVSIAANTEETHDGVSSIYYAVADDGTAWRYEYKWEQLPALPDKDV